MRLASLALALFLPFALAAPAAAQDDHVAEVFGHANAHFDAGDWTEAIEAFRHGLGHDPANGNATFRLGFALIQAGQPADARPVFERCLELSVAVGPSTYNIACCSALTGDTEGGLQWLARAVEGGFDDFELARTDGDLAAIRGDARFEPILAGKPYAVPDTGKVKLRSGGSVEDFLRQGNAARDAGDAKAAAAAYAKAVALEPKNGFAHFQRGYVSIQARDFLSAEASFLQSRALGFAVPASTYNLACTNALQGNIDIGLTWLERAVQEGFADAELLRTDSDLDALRKDSRFAKIVARVDGGGDVVAAAPAPPKAALTARHREFDFWAGDWVVLDKSGKQIGKNRIEVVHGGAALHENWTSAAGNTGSSLTFYDAAQNRWHQTWIDQSGQALFVDGGLVDGSMVLGNQIGERRNRITWTPMPDGRVRQIWQASADGGKSWADAFDGFYVRREKPADQQEY
ncbi:MAG TPA: tetratricopeptide repeat protein [Planctomycetota bacterium]